LYVSVISLVYIASLVVVIWAIADIVRQPSYLMSRNRKLGWGLAIGLGWLALGFVGAIVAGVYLAVVRTRRRALR
jgi:protein-S-isoprenylcysteine O-methyltransferase Ste14